MPTKKSKTEKDQIQATQVSKPDNSVRVAIISTIGVIATTLITALFAPAILKMLDRTPTPLSYAEATLTSAPVSENEIFVDDFTINSKYWDTDCIDSDSWSASCSIVDGAYRWRVAGLSTSSIAWLSPTLPPVSDFDLEFDLKLIDYSPEIFYGLCLRNSKAGEYHFMLNHRGDYSFFKVQHLENGNNYIELIPWTHESVININQENKIRVNAVGNKFRLYINDKLVGDVSDSSYSNGYIYPVIYLDKDITATIDIARFKLTLIQ